MTAPAADRATVVIEPPSRWSPIRFRELWAFRDLLYFLAWRDIKVRYKQTLLGVLWAVLQPALTMLVFTLFFGRLARVPSDGVPYPVFSLAGLLPWQLFVYSVTESSNSLVSNRTLITKVYFPRLFVPAAGILAGLVDFAIAFALLLVIMPFYGIVPRVSILALPVFIFLTVLTAAAAGLWLSALNVRYRDVRYAIPFLTQFWLFLTPVAYPTSLVPAKWRLLYGMNPLTGVVEGFRWALLGSGQGPDAVVFLGVGVVVLFFVSGLFYFRSVESTFADTL